MSKEVKTVNKTEFLNQLDAALRGMTYQEKQDIMADYTAHFSAGAEQGLSEEEIAAALGNPRAIAKAYRADYMVEQARNKKSAGNIFRAILAVLSLSFFNIVFVLGPFLCLLAALMGLWAAALGLTLASPVGAIFVSASLIFPHLIFGLGTTSAVALVFIFIGLGALGLLACIGLYYLSSWFFKITIKYLNFNMRIITGRSSE